MTCIAVGTIVQAQGDLCRGKQLRRQRRGVVWKCYGVVEGLRRVGNREV